MKQSGDSDGGEHGEENVGGGDLGQTQEDSDGMSTHGGASGHHQFEAGGANSGSAAVTTLGARAGREDACQGPCGIAGNVAGAGSAPLPPKGFGPDCKGGIYPGGSPDTCGTHAAAKVGGSAFLFLTKSSDTAGTEVGGRRLKVLMKQERQPTCMQTWTTIGWLCSKTKTACIG